MSRIVLITGGGRSGKSAYAQNLAESLRGNRVYVATCPVMDDELAERVRKHKEARSRRQWVTIEEPVALADVLHQATSYQVVLVDCLTLWVNNLMYHAEQSGEALTEEDISDRCRDVLTACSESDGTVIFVTNEVGMGIVPDNPLSRRYRDLAGRCNQEIAARADDVTLMVCGLPLHLKQGKVS